MTAWLREFPADERVQRTKALDLLGRRYFEPPGNASLVTSPERVAEVLTIAREEWARYEPVCRAMLGDDETSMPAEGCAAAVRKMLGI